MTIRWHFFSGRMKHMNDNEKHYVYILNCADGTFYTGWTTDLEKRVREHNSGKGAKYTRSRIPVTLIYYEVFDQKPEALRRERAIKQLSRKQKEALVSDGETHSIPGTH